MFKKPNKKSLASQGTTISSAVVGGAISDGLVGLVPEEYRKWGKPAFALACAIASASTKSTSTTGQVLQGAFAGMSIKQGLDSLRELVLTNVSPQDADSQIGQFANRVLGLSSADIQNAPPVTLKTSMFSRDRSALAHAPKTEQPTGDVNDMLA